MEAYKKTVSDRNFNAKPQPKHQDYYDEEFEYDDELQQSIGSRKGTHEFTNEAIKF